MNLKVLIIEDESIAAQNLAWMLSEIDPEIAVVNQIDTVRQSVKWLKENQVDLIFMDIHLSDDNCFKIFEEIEVRIPVIFTTAYDQYSIKAFKVNSIDYLLKPIDMEDLRMSLKKFESLFNKQLTYNQLVEYLKNQSQREYQQRFLVHAGLKIKSIKTQEIAYFYSMEKNTFLHSYENKSYGIDQSLDAIESLMDPKVFFRINRKFLIHIDSIANMFILSKSQVKIELNPPTQEEVLVSLSKSNEFKQWLNL